MNIITMLIHPTISKFKAINEIIYGTRNVNISPVEFLQIFEYVQWLGEALPIIAIVAVDIINTKEIIIIVTI